MISPKTKLLIIVALSLAAIAIAYFLAKQSPFCTAKTSASANTTERTLAIIKPDAVAAGNTENIINAIKEYWL